MYMTDDRRAIGTNVRDFTSPVEADDEVLLDFRTRLSEVDRMDDKFSLASEEDLSREPIFLSLDNQVVKLEATAPPHLFI